jgi:DNA-binding IclR family transcriptional regulator
VAETNRAATETAPPQAQMIQMATAHWVSRLLHVAAQLNLADYLTDGPRTAENLAESTATHAPALYRVLRTLASLGLFTEDAAHRFSLTALGEVLRTGTPGSVRASVLTLTSQLFTRALDNLLYSIQTGIREGFRHAAI